MTEHFSLAEMIRTDRGQAAGLDNTPPGSILPALRLTCEGLERIRAILKQPIIILSGYRSPEVNALVKGSKNSQHILGEAADIICPKYGSPYEVAKIIESNAKIVGYDQLVYEHGWVHVSFGNRDRLQALTFNGKKYLRGIIA